MLEQHGVPFQTLRRGGETKLVIEEGYSLAVEVIMEQCHVKAVKQEESSLFPF